MFFGARSHAGQWRAGLSARRRDLQGSHGRRLSARQRRHGISIPILISVDMAITGKSRWQSGVRVGRFERVIQEEPKRDWLQPGCACALPPHAPNKPKAAGDAATVSNAVLIGLSFSRRRIGFGAQGTRANVVPIVAPPPPPSTSYGIAAHPPLLWPVPCAGARGVAHVWFARCASCAMTETHFDSRRPLGRRHEVRLRPHAHQRDDIAPRASPRPHISGQLRARSDTQSGRAQAPCPQQGIGQGSAVDAHIGRRDARRTMMNRVGEA